MTNEEIEAKALDLGVKHNCKVFPLVFKDPENNEDVIGFLKEPPRFVKMRVMDKALSNPISSCAEVLDAYIIKEESDPRIYSESQENDAYYMGATMEVYSIIKISNNKFKKK
mgnify:FL=1|jgi:hypothetical protein